MNRQPIVTSEAVQAGIAEGRRLQGAAVRAAVATLAKAIVGAVRTPLRSTSDEACPAC